MKPGTESNPLRVAVIGAGPAGFYLADYLFKQKDLIAEVDMFDRLPTPFGLVRHGVAPDHQKIKNVTKVFNKTAAHPRFRFYGNVECGRHMSPADFRDHYHQIVYTVGAQTDRSLSIPGEDLAGSHSATEFVAWYNGHPDYRHLTFDLSQPSVAIVGVGNVAVDVARILCRTADELATTDITDYALEALRESNVEQVVMLGRRGPAQAAFSVPELKELGKLPNAQVRAVAEEVVPDPLTRAWLQTHENRPARQKVELLNQYAAADPAGTRRTLTIRFLVSPTELIGDETGRVKAMKITHNELCQAEDGTLRPRPTDRVEQIDTGLVFRSVGYRGVPITSVPFDATRGVIRNEKGRIIGPKTGKPCAGQYAAGWIKRGPTGLIGTNKADAIETVQCMLEDLATGITLNPSRPNRDEAEQRVRRHQPDYFSYEQWRKLDEHEMLLGQPLGRPRVKLTSVRQMIEHAKPCAEAKEPRIHGSM